MLQDRCAITTTLDVRGVLEAVTKGCVPSETCSDHGDLSTTGHCVQHSTHPHVRCVTCDDVIPGTCSPVGATSSSRYAGKRTELVSGDISVAKIVFVLVFVTVTKISPLKATAPRLELITPIVLYTKLYTNWTLSAISR